MWILKRYENKKMQTESMKRLKEIREFGEKAKKVGETLREQNARREQEGMVQERETARKEQCPQLYFAFFGLFIPLSVNIKPYIESGGHK